MKAPPQRPMCYLFLLAGLLPLEDDDDSEPEPADEEDAHDEKDEEDEKDGHDEENEENEGEAHDIVEEDEAHQFAQQDFDMDAGRKAVTLVFWVDENSIILNLENFNLKKGKQNHTKKSVGKSLEIGRERLEHRKKIYVHVKARDQAEAIMQKEQAESKTGGFNCKNCYMKNIDFSKYNSLQELLEEKEAETIGKENDVAEMKTKMVEKEAKKQQFE
ncbi:unnamed protein product [Caenorhabditis brenneri]